MSININKPSISAIIVTYNRQKLLENCLLSITKQARQPDRIIIVNNASTDNTGPWLANWLPKHILHANCLNLKDNQGGAGGFHAGMRNAMDQGADWLWIMDDDAVPEPDALQNLLEIADNPANIYGSLAVSGKDTAWATQLMDENRIVEKAADIPAQASVQFLPFLGLLVHRQLIEKIGLPDPGFFICADDLEYCLRAREAGADIIIAGNSRIEHPKSRPYRVKIPGRTLICLELSPWKRYYDTRNRLLVARRHYGWRRLLIQTIPGSFVRLMATLLHEPDKAAQLQAFIGGFFDGLLGRKGKRHQNWGI